MGGWRGERFRGRLPHPTKTKFQPQVAFFFLKLDTPTPPRKKKGDKIQISYLFLSAFASPRTIPAPPLLLVGVLLLERQLPDSLPPPVRVASEAASGTWRPPLCARRV